MAERRRSCAIDLFVLTTQMFKKSVKVATQGDRVGILVTQLDAKLVERGIMCAVGSMPSFSGTDRGKIYCISWPGAGPAQTTHVSSPC